VGINVPNATVMLIEDADRFGLAALHQLRGRIGRGPSQSYCIFMSSSTNEHTMKRLDILNRSNDGFMIAEEDLKQRGPGDVFGIRQSGDIRFKIGDIYTDSSILKKAAEDADLILKEDPSLSLPKHKDLKSRVEGATRFSMV
ncbi:MAG: ATP-dependent DNA helicase RecG, partial [Lachnospiraceae bacterium]|nr:ATP-dependent DNA helicase RecG [Lachnospiraceae bacterium]